MRKLLIILSAVILCAIGIVYCLDARIPRATATIRIHPAELTSGVGTLHSGTG